MITWAVRLTYMHPDSKEVFVNNYVVLTVDDKNWECAVEMAKYRLFKEQPRVEITQISEQCLFDSGSKDELVTLIDHHLSDADESITKKGGE